LGGALEINFVGQIIVNWLVLGLTYCLVALGITLIFSILRIVNFAHGQFYMLGAFATYLIYVELGQNFLIALFGAVIVTGALGVILERTLFRPLRDKMLATLVVSLGISLFLEGGALLIFGPNEKGVPSPFKGTLNLAGIFISKERLSIIVICIVLVAGLFFFIQRIKQGQAMRAFAQDREAATLQGINVNKMSWMGFGIGCALAAAAGGLLLPITFVDPFVGLPVVFNAFIIMILGGLGSVTGALVGGLLLGLIRSVGYTFLPGAWSALIASTIALVFLLVRPQGIMGYEE
jgi:branched-chain amino acid transport system permease protein